MGCYNPLRIIFPKTMCWHGKSSIHSASQQTLCQIFDYMLKMKQWAKEDMLLASQESYNQERKGNQRLQWRQTWYRGNAKGDM